MIYTYIMMLVSVKLGWPHQWWFCLHYSSSYFRNTMNPLAEYYTRQ